ncbi:hypothetical protein OUZ56_029500 [Daphnia magna]|uniref:Uncharacterized protein n=1 Tax=Daphnia magna TaxID=35525 RepID=A0ABR0B706_9CRUS|nr:hypothetical protein OUZ56_029500 [Daphnia magna]
MRIDCLSHTSPDWPAWPRNSNHARHGVMKMPFSLMQASEAAPTCNNQTALKVGALTRDAMDDVLRENSSDMTTKRITKFPMRREKSPGACGNNHMPMEHDI